MFVENERDVPLGGGKQPDEERLKKWFSALDKDKDGVVSEAEFTRPDILALFHKGAGTMSGKKLDFKGEFGDGFFPMLDADHDKTITLQEFLQNWNSEKDEQGVLKQIFAQFPGPP